jgi:hypothetical protein
MHAQTGTYSRRGRSSAAAVDGAKCTISLKWQSFDQMYSLFHPCSYHINVQFFHDLQHNTKRLHEAIDRDAQHAVRCCAVLSS